MRRKISKQTFVWITVFALVFSVLSGCTKAVNNSSTTATPQVKKESTPQRDPITLTVFGPPMVGVEAGIQTDPISQEIEKRFNVKINVVDPKGNETDKSKMNLMLASGDLPDIFFAGKTLLPQLIQGNLIVPLDDLIKSHGPEITKEARALLDFSRKEYSDNTGKLYVIPTQDGPPPKPFDYSNIGPNVRWDLYKDLGFPQYKNWDEFLAIAKQMQNKNPANEKGQKVYAFSGWSDWGLWFYTTFTSFYISGVTNYLGFIDLKPDNTIVPNGLKDENNVIWKSAKFWNKVNNMGLLDPDTFTQKYDNFIDKLKNNRVLINVAGWAGGVDVNNQFLAAGQPLKGFQALPPFEGGYAYLGYSSTYGNSSRNFAISKKSKYPERAMEVINFMMSYEGNMYLYNGVKGLTWSDDGGNAKLSEIALSNISNPDPDFNKKQGLGVYYNFAGRGPGMINPQYNTPLLLNSTQQAFNKQMTKALEVDYSKHYGVSYPGEVVEKMAKAGKAIILDFKTTDVGALLPTPDDEVNRINSDITNYLVSIVPKLILTKSDEEFAKVQKEAMAQIEKLGYNKEYDWYMKAYKDAAAKLASLQK